MGITFIDEPASKIQFLDDAESAELIAAAQPPQPKAGFLRTAAGNLGNFALENLKTIKGLAVGFTDEQKADYEAGARKVAETLGVRSAISKTVPLTDSILELSAGVAHSAAGAIDRPDWQKEITSTIQRSRESTAKLDAWNAVKDQDAIVGPKWAARLRAADQSITESVGIGAAAGPLASSALADFYAIKSTQDYLKDHPDSPWMAGVHGLLEGATTKFFMDKLHPTTAKLAGVKPSPLYSRAVAKVKERIPLGDTLASLGAEVAEEVVLYNEHYFADVLAGVEKHDWTKYGEGLKETLIQTGLTAGAGEAAMGIANTMASRESALESTLDAEISKREQRLTALEQEYERPGFAEPRTPDAELGGRPALSAQDTREQSPSATLGTTDVDSGGSRSAARSHQERLADIEQREHRLGQAMADASRRRKLETPGGEINPSAEPVISPIDFELSRMAEAEKELSQLRQDLLDDANVGSPRREQLMSDLEEMQANLAERLTRMADMDVQPPIESTPQTKTKAQRRLDRQQSKLDKATAKTQAVREQYRKDKIVRQELVADAFDLIQESLPPQERIGLERRASSIKTPEAFDKFMSVVDDRVAKYGHKLASKRVSAALQKASRLAGTEAAIGEIVEPVDFGSTRSRNEIVALKHYIDSNPQADIPAGYADAIKRLEKIPAKDLTTAELNQLADAIDAVAGEKANSNRLFTIGKEVTADTFTQQVLTEVVDNIPVQSGLLGQAAGEVGATLGNISFRPESILAGMSESLRRLAYESIGVDAFRDYLRKKGMPIQRMTQLLNRMGLSPIRELSKTFQGGSALNQWRYGTKRIGGQSITRAEALHIFGLMTDPQAAARLTKHGATLGRTLGWRNHRLKPAHIEINEGTLREIGEFIGDEGKAIAIHAIEQINGPMRDDVNAAWMAKYNKPLSERTDYFPIRLDKDYHNKNADPWAALHDLTLDSYSITKERADDSAAPLQIYDFFNVYGNHADTVARISAYTAPVDDFHKVYKRPEVKKAIVAATSEGTYNGILDAINQHVLPINDTGFFSKLSRRLTRGSGAAILGLRLTTPFYNVSGLMTASQHIPAGEKLAMSALGRMKDATEQNRMEQLLQEHSPYWAERYSDVLGEFSGGVAGVHGHFHPGNFVEQAAMYHITTADKFAGIARGFMAELHVEQNRGISRTDPSFNEEVAKEWERLTYRSESTSHGLEATAAVRFGRTHGLAAPFVQFESGSSKDRSLLMKAGQDMREGRYKSAAKASAAWGANRVWVAAIAYIFSQARGGDDEFADKLAQEFGGSLGPGSVGGVARDVVRSLRGLNTYDGPATSLGDVMLNSRLALNDLARAFYLYQTNGMDDEGDPAYPKAVASGLAKFIPLVESVTRIPYSTGTDDYTILANAFGFSNPDHAKAISHELKSINDAGSIAIPRNRIYKAILDGDDAAFLQGCAEIWEKNPKRLTPATLKDVVDSRFRSLAQLEKQPDMRLSAAGQRYVEHQQAERNRLYAELTSMVQRNAGQLESLMK